MINQTVTQMEYGLAPTNANIWTCLLPACISGRIFNSLEEAYCFHMTCLRNTVLWRCRVLISVHFSASLYMWPPERASPSGLWGAGPGGQTLPSPPLAGPAPSPMRGASRWRENGYQYPQGAETRGRALSDPEIRVWGTCPWMSSGF